MRGHTESREAGPRAPGGAHGVAEALQGGPARKAAPLVTVTHVDPRRRLEAATAYYKPGVCLRLIPPRWQNLVSLN